MTERTVTGTAARQVLLVGHGSVERLEDVPPFLANIRHGRPAPPELVAEVCRRYQAIGGSSPLLALSQSQARRLAERLRVPVRLGTRFWHPYVRDVIAEMIRGGCEELAVVSLAPYSGHLYDREVERIVSDLGQGLGQRGATVPRLCLGSSFGTEPTLVRGFASALRDALASLPPARAAAAHVVLSAHSLPESVIRAGDPYQRDVERAAEAVIAAAGIANPWRVAFQSQGATHEPWIGPDLAATFAAIAATGAKDVLVVPIGFIADHVEILYDIDIEARRVAAREGLKLTRTASLNDGPAVIETLARVAAAAFAGAPVVMQ